MIHNTNEKIKYPIVYEKPVYWGNINSKFKVPSPEHKAIVNTETGTTYYIASQKYKLLRHEEAINAIESVIDTMPEFGKYEREVEFYQHEDARMHVTWTFPEIKYDIGDNDLVNPTIEAHNSYDGGLVFSTSFGAFRQVCANGLIVGEKFAVYRKKHMDTLYISEMRKVLETGMEQFAEQTEIWKTWVDKITAKDDFSNITDILNKRELTEIMQTKEISSNIKLSDYVEFEEIIDDETKEVKTETKVLQNMSYWLFYNILTQYVTHNIANKNRQILLQNQLKSVF